MRGRRVEGRGRSSRKVKRRDWEAGGEQREGNGWKKNDRQINGKEGDEEGRMGSEGSVEGGESGGGEGRGGGSGGAEGCRERVSEGQR